MQNEERLVDRVLQLASLWVITLLMLQGFRQVLDLHVGDEAHFLQCAKDMIAGDLAAGQLASGAVHIALYAVLLGLGAGGAEAQDAMVVLVHGLTATAIWWALRPMLRPATATLAAAWFAVSYPWLIAPIKLHLLSAALTFAAVGTAARGHRIAALAILALAACNRPELLFWLAGAAFLLALHGHRAKDARLRRWSVAVFAAACLATIGSASWEPARQRAWTVFGMHYGLADPRAMVAAADAGAARRLAAAFPGADSVAEAAMVNPAAMARHVGSNLLQVPRHVIDVVAHPLGHAPVVHGIVTASAAALAVIGLLTVVLRRGERRESRTEETLLPMVFMTTAALALIPLLVIRPRVEYLLALTPGVFFGLGTLARLGWRTIGASASGRDATARAAILATALAAAVGGPFVTPATERPQSRALVSLLRQHPPPPDALLAAPAAASLRALADTDGPGLDTELWMAGSPIPRTPDYAVLSSWDYGTPRAAALLRELVSDRWRVVAAETDCLLFARRR